MKEQHPIDDLFARALRDGEADPPAALWGRIAGQRHWSHTLLERLRKSWGWLVLALLLLGGGTYWALGTESRPASGGPVAEVEAAAPTIAASATPAHPHGQSTTPVDAATSDHGIPVDATPPPFGDATSKGHGEVLPTPAGTTSEQTVPTTSRSLLKSPEATLADTRVMDVVPTGQSPQMEGATAQLSLEPATRGTGPIPVATEREEASSMAIPVHPERPERKPDVGSGSTGLLTDRSRVAVARLAPLYPALPVALPATDPFSMPAPKFRPKRPSMWVGLTVAPYLESRSWQGDDQAWVQALQRTETPHYTTAIGAMAGLEWRGGWGLATGVEYSGVRYAFNHLDRYRDVRDSVITHVVTFNAVVVGSFTDTVPVTTEVQRSMAATNRYSMLSVPVEGSWHQGWRRWHFGARLGVGVDIHTMHSGFVLLHSADGTRSVEVGEAHSRTDIQLSGGGALDIGYAFTERLGLWASPGYSTGLLSLSSTDGTPYALSARSGVRFRLAYLFSPTR